MASNIKINPKRDIDIFKYLWKWKVATTQMIRVAYFKDCEPLTAYRRLKKLKDYGYLRLVTSRSGYQKFWGLNINGFNFIKNYLPELKEKGYKSEAPTHDLICALVQQGSWLLNPVAGLELVSDQQLRRYNPEFLPAWVPRDFDHRPDGYWRVQRKLIMALEVELNQKSKTRLNKTLEFYADNNNVDKILWVVPRMTDLKKIIQQSKIVDRELLDRQNIILLNDFFKLLWDAKVLCGPELGSSIHQVLLQNPHKMDTKASHNVVTNFLTDSRLTPRKDLVAKNNLSSLFLG